MDSGKSSKLYSTGVVLDYLIQKVQIPLVAIFWAFDKSAPAPTHETVNKHNSHLLISLRDLFFQHERGNSGRYHVFRGIFNYAIVKYDTDNFYSERIDWLLEQWQKTDWVLRTGKYPGRSWDKEAR